MVGVSPLEVVEAAVEVLSAVAVDSVEPPQAARLIAIAPVRPKAARRLPRFFIGVPLFLKLSIQCFIVSAKRRFDTELGNQPFTAPTIRPLT